MNLDAIYREALEYERVEEPTNDLSHAWSELEYQALWYSGTFGSTFRATNGSSIEILQFGFWNKEAGPDFVHALIRVNGIQTLAGDIELDLSAADWERHLHGENPAFRNVVLHVFLRRSGVACFTRTIEHREVLQLELTQDYHSIIVETEIDPAKPGACCGPLARFPDQKVNQILETAARLRLERKTQLLRRAVHIHGIDQQIHDADQIVVGERCVLHGQQPQQQLDVRVQRLPVPACRPAGQSSPDRGRQGEQRPRHGGLHPYRYPRHRILQFRPPPSFCNDHQAMT